MTQPTDATPVAAPDDATDLQLDEQVTEPTGNAEAAKYRRKLRDAQGQLDTARQAVDAAHRALAEHLASAERVRPAALWASGVTLDQLRDEAGNIDPAKVRDAAEHAAAELGLSRIPRPDMSQGGHGASAPPPPSWASAFAPPRN